MIWADDIRGPWSEPIDLKIGQIDPGHAVGPDGRRYLFLSAGYRVAAGRRRAVGDRRAGEGLRRLEDTPSDWIVEGFAQEGPKILRRGDYYYMVLAEGGTAGPPTGHMIVSARSRSIDGPWENSPYNPIVRTRSARRALVVARGTARWSRTPTAAGGWSITPTRTAIYTLGRQTLLEPIEWTGDGWFRTAPAIRASRSRSRPARPVRTASRSPTTSRRDRMGMQWSFYKGDVG